MSKRMHVGGLTLLVALAQLGAAACDAPSRAGPAVPVNIEQMYGQMCARCHGADGRGDAEMKKTIPTIRDFADPNFRGAAPEQIEQVIMAGRNQMPGFGNALSRPKIQHLGGYARKLGDAAAKAQGLPPVKAPLPVAPKGPGM
jgi:mono/diheme cytochrome c family protein